MPTIPTPTIRCYWVAEGKLLAGAYPGARDRSDQRQRIEQLRQAGLRTFINLVEEDEADMNGQPYVQYEDVLRDLSQQTGDRVAHLRFPIPDLSIPSVGGMRSILDAIDLSIAASRPVYLHCLGGIGRTGAVVCCWMLRHGLATPQNVIDVLCDMRQADRQTSGRKSPQTRVQVEFVENWSDVADNRLNEE